MALVQDDYVVEHVSPAVANEALCNAVLPWTSEAGPLWRDVEAPDGVYDFFVELSSTVKDQVLWCRIVREGFAQLLRDPCAGRMLRHVAMQDAPTVMRDHEKAIDYLKRERGHSKEVHCSNRFSVVAEKAFHRLAGSGLLGAFRIQRCTVGSETSKPSIFNSP